MTWACRSWIRRLTELARRPWSGPSDGLSGDSAPGAPSSLIPAALCLFLGLLGARLVGFGVGLRYVRYPALLIRYPELRSVFSIWAPPAIVSALSVLATVAGLLYLTAAFAAVVRRGGTLVLIRRVCIAGYVLFVVYTYAALALTGKVAEYAFGNEHFKVDGEAVDAVAVFYWRYFYLLPAVFVLFATAVIHLAVGLRRTINEYTGSHDTAPAW